jgi:deoxycytidylate deaminase
MPLTRLDIHFLKMARLQGEKSSFAKKKRGAVIAKNNRVISVGVSSHLDSNQALQAHSKLSENERYVATVNAELVAMGAAIRGGVTLNDVTMYISDPPNWITFKTMVTMGIKRIVHYGAGKGERVTHYARMLGIEILGIG